MRWALALLLLAAACRTRVPAQRDSDLYGGVGVSGLPHVGGSITAGQYFSKLHPKFDFAFEMRGVYQGGDDSATQSGKFAQIQAGVKQSLSPGHPHRLFFRYGATWFRATGDPNIIDKPGDYFGAYGAVGYEWDVGERFTVSPEFGAAWVEGEGGLSTEVVPRVALNLLFNF